MCSWHPSPSLAARSLSLGRPDRRLRAFKRNDPRAAGKVCHHLKGDCPIETTNRSISSPSSSTRTSAPKNGVPLQTSSIPI